MWTPYASVYNPLKAGSIDGTDTEPHDHAVVRAMEVHYKPNKLVVGDPRCTLFVARLNPDTSEETLKNFFSRYGEIVQCRLVLDMVTGFSKCYGFVEFKDRYSTVEAHRDSYKAVLDNHEIFVDYECERILEGWVPRRLGGGFSGKKESGQLRFGGRDRPFRKPIILTKPLQVAGGRDDNLPELKHREERRDYREGLTHRYSASRSSHKSERKHHRENSHSDRSPHRDKHRKDSREMDRDSLEKESRHRDSLRNYKH